MINFYKNHYFLSIDRKMDVLRLIDTLGANTNVGYVYIGLDSSNEWDDEILSTMISRYTNVHTICVYENDDHIDHRRHRIIKQWV